MTIGAAQPRRMLRTLSAAGRLLLVLAFCLAALSCGQARAAEKRVALVIGNSAYRSAPVLANPVRDASSIAEMFKKAGFTTVELKQDLESLELKRAIRAFLATAKDSEIAVVFFAGHGIEVNGANYIIPVDARLKTDFDAEDEGVVLERIIRAVEPAKRLRLIILDACRDNPFIPQMQRTVSLRGITAGLGKIEPTASDTLVAYAARAGSVADDGATEHSPFTTALLKHLTTPGLDIRVALGRVRDDVVRDTGGKQEPFVYGSLGGSTVSLVPEKPVAVLKQTDPGTDNARGDYLLADRIGTRDAWNYFLQAHPTGFLADLARAQLLKLPEDAASAATAHIDAAKPANKRPTAAPPVRMESRRHDAVEPKQEPTQVIQRSACDRDRETLAMLRDRQVAEEIAKFARELQCEALRPQVARLLESSGSNAPTIAAAKTESAQKLATNAPTAPVAVRAERSASNCEDEIKALARLRSAPSLDAVQKFERDLTCKTLKPQVVRLRESLQED